MLSSIGLITPEMHPDQRTIFAEQLLLQGMKEQEAERRSNAIDHYASFVKKVGGDRAAAIGPSIFGGLVDPTVFEALKGVPSYSDMMTQKMQEMLQSQTMRGDQQMRDIEARGQQQMQDIQLRDTDMMARVEEQIAARGDTTGASQKDRDLTTLSKILLAVSYLIKKALLERCRII